jgi:hypothetical protein
MLSADAATTRYQHISGKLLGKHILRYLFELAQGLDSAGQGRREIGSSHDWWVGVEAASSISCEQQSLIAIFERCREFGLERILLSVCT